MKIGFFTDGYFPQINGVAVSVADCAKALEKRGHEVYIVAPKYPGGYKDEKNVIRISSVQIPRQPEYRLATFFPNKALVTASKIDFDIIHGHSGGTVTLLGWEVSRFKRIPFVVTYHTLWNQYTHYILQGKVIKPKMAEIASRIFGNLCDTLIVPTEKVKEELLSYGIDKPIAIIPSGLDLERFVNKKSGYLRETYSIPQDTKIMLYVGRLSKEKSVEFLLKSFKKVLASDKNVTFVLVGDGPDKSRLETLSKKLGITDSVLFTGYISQEQLPDIYADADIFVFASRSETQGLVVLEAMASGVPVVAVKDEAFTYLIEHSVNGLLVNGKLGEFSDSLLKLLEDENMRKRMGEKAREVISLYSADDVAIELEKLYEELLRKNSKKIDSRFKQLTKYLSLKSIL